MRAGPYRIEPRRENLKRAAAAITGIAVYVPVAYAIGYAAHTHTAYEIHESYPLPVGYVMAGSALFALALLAGALTAGLVLSLFDIEEVSER